MHLARFVTLKSSAGPVCAVANNVPLIFPNPLLPASVVLTIHFPLALLSVTTKTSSQLTPQIVPFNLSKDC